MRSVRHRWKRLENMSLRAGLSVVQFVSIKLCLGAL